MGEASALVAAGAEGMVGLWASGRAAQGAGGRGTCSVRHPARDTVPGLWGRD